MAHHSTFQLHEVTSLPRIIAVRKDLSLAQLAPNDGPVVYDLLERNPDFYKYIAWTTTIDSVSDVIPSLQAYSNQNMDGRYGIVSADGLHGYVGVYKTGPEYALSYGLDKNARGRGYARAAVSTLVGVAYSELNARVFTMQIQAENVASAQLAMSLGATAAEKVMGVDFPVMQQRWRLEGAALEACVRAEG